MGILLRGDFTSILKQHDWFYQMSDDHSVYVRGHDSYRALVNLLQEVQKNQPALLEEVKKFYDDNVTDRLRELFAGHAGPYSVLESFINQGVCK